MAKRVSDPQAPAHIKFRARTALKEMGRPAKVGDERVRFYCSLEPGTLAHESLPTHFEKTVVSGQPPPSGSKTEGLGSDNWLWVNSSLFL